MNFKEELEQRTREAEEIIKSYLPKEEGFAKNMAEAMNYSMLSGGKRLRPVFMREVYSMFGGTGKVIEPFMAAMEMIHTHSLIHDDLPALDNDEYRRGRKTTHAVYGEPAAILAGDALLNYAYETAFRAFDLLDESDMEEWKRVAKALSILGKKTGIDGMLGGQSVDVENDKKEQELDREMLDYIYENKTSALIECAMTIGATLAGAREEEIQKIETLAGKIGIAFQIQDDILDVTGTMEELGKAVGSDEKNHKTTYVTLEGIKKAGEDVKELTKEALNLLMKPLGFFVSLQMKRVFWKNCFSLYVPAENRGAKEMLLETIEKENDIKKIPLEQMPVLAQEIRDFLLESLSKTGGHLASNLGAVELTMALHYVFSLPKDKIIWDVGHQSYTHKILTGRKDGFKNLRQYGGLSGFPKREESPCDAYDTGHSSTSISAGVGYVCASKVSGEEYHVVSV